MFTHRDLFPVVFDGEDGTGGGGASETSTEETEGSASTTEEEFDKDRALATIRKQRESEATAKKRAQELEAKLKEYEDRDKSEQEKATEKAAAAEQRAATAEQATLRLEVALEKAPDGMSLGQVRKLAKRLSGSTKEELEADADELFADFAPNGDGGGKDPARRPKERLKSGAVPSSEPEETDPIKLAAKVPRMY